MPPPLLARSRRNKLYWGIAKFPDGSLGASHVSLIAIISNRCSITRAEKSSKQEFNDLIFT